MTRDEAVQKLQEAGYDYDDARFAIMTWGATPTGLLADQPQGEVSAEVQAILAATSQPKRSSSFWDDMTTDDAIKLGEMLRERLTKADALIAKAREANTMQVISLEDRLWLDSVRYLRRDVEDDGEQGMGHYIAYTLLEYNIEADRRRLAEIEADPAAYAATTNAMRF